MEKKDRLCPEDISADLAPLTLWRGCAEIAEAAAQLLLIYREIEPLGGRLIRLPGTWTPAHEEVLLLFQHLVESLAALRPQARLILQAFGERPGGCEFPDVAPRELLARVIQRIDGLDRVAALSESDRSLLPLHIAEIAADAEELVALERWLLRQENRSAFMPAFLWRLAESLDRHLARSHIFDRCESERGVLSIIGRLLTPH